MQVGETKTYKLPQIYNIRYTYFPCYKIYQCYLCLGSTYIIFYANSTYFEICLVFLCQLYIRYKDQALYSRQPMGFAGCWNWWRGGCYNFRMDGLYASIWGAY